MKTVIFTLLAFFIFLSGCAMHEDVLLLNDRLEYMEQHFNTVETKNKNLSSQMDDIKKKGGEKAQNIKSQYAELRILHERMMADIQVLNGKVEELDHLLNNHIAEVEASQSGKDGKLGRMNERLAVNTVRIAHMEKYLGLEKSGKSSSTAGTGSSKKKRKTLSKDKLYLSAKQAFDRGELETSRERFQSLIKKYPKSKNADNAQFWIGEIHFREKWYEKAILEYQKVIENYPLGNKVPAALLKQGLAFHRIGEDANARLVLNELLKKFPKSNEATIAQKKIKGLK